MTITTRKFFIRIAGIIMLCALLAATILSFFDIQSTYERIRLHGSGNVNVLQSVNPFIGSTGGGNTFPGAVYPHGMMQWSPDNVNGTNGTSYDYNKNFITHFSLTNFSGRGCPSHQDIAFMPTVGALHTSPQNESAYQSTFSHANEIATPGSYSVKLDTPNTTVQLSTTQRSGFGRFVFPSSANATLLINPSASADGNINPISISINPGKNEITGWTTTGSSCGSLHYTVYFAVITDTKFTSYGTWSGATIKAGSVSATNPGCGAYIIFNTTQNRTVQIKTGISYVSTANALDNISQENTTWNIADIQNAASNAWADRLSQIEVSGGSAHDATVFYTALYHTLIHPSIFSDANGQYIGFDNKIHTVGQGHIHYQDIPGWDEYRTLIPLLSLLEPDVTGDIIQSIVTDSQEDPGHGLPRWEIANANSGGMEGDPYDNIISTAYALGVRGFDTNAALNAMVYGATNSSAKSSGHIERDFLSDYVTKGYVYSNSDSNSASKTIEYSLDDYAIAQFAKSLGNTGDYTTFLNRSHNWENLFHNGYITPKDSSGHFAVQGPGDVHGFMEGTNSQYTWMVAQDLPKLIQLMGGDATAIQRLDTLFTKLNDGTGSQYAYMGNEPSEVLPWAYIFAGAPYKSQSVVRRIQTQLFTVSTNGLPGNDDAGALSSWYIFSAIGLFPQIQGQSGFAIGAPVFPSITIHLENGNTVSITAPDETDSTPYITALSLNTQAYNTNPWLNFGSIKNGALLQYTVSDTPNTGWGASIDIQAPVIPPVSPTQTQPSQSPVPNPSHQVTAFPTQSPQIQSHNEPTPSQGLNFSNTPSGRSLPSATSPIINSYTPGNSSYTISTNPNTAAASSITVVHTGPNYLLIGLCVLASLGLIAIVFVILK